MIEVYSAKCIMNETGVDTMTVSMRGSDIRFIMQTDGDNDISVWLDDEMARELANKILEAIGS